MLDYHFSNDTRYEDLTENLEAVAKYIQTNIWEHSKFTFDQANNGFLHLYVLIFGLYKGSNNIKAIMEGQTNKVVLEYAKKYQYPNPRNIKSNNTFASQIKNQQELAPLRVTIKILFMKYINNDLPKLTLDEIDQYILSNDDVAKNKINIINLYNDIISGNNKNPIKNYNYYGGDPNRFISSMVGLLNVLPFIEYKRNNGGSLELLLDNLNENERESLLDVIIFDEFWNIDPLLSRNESIQSYKDYMQVNIDDILKKETQRKSFISSEPYNLIFYGAPGTGKSYSLNEKVKHIYPDFDTDDSNDSQYVFRTTFHPEYTYSDFVGQIMPVVNEDSVSYEFSEGVFTRALKKALEVQPDSKPVFLVLEELSRANVSSIFGDLFQLLDRVNGVSEYAINQPSLAQVVYGEDIKDRKIYLPDNLFIYGSVNTNDQNVFAMDTAFKRRFEWEYISTTPKNNENNPTLQIKVDDQNTKDIEWHEFYMTLNKFITNELQLSEDKQLGQFFIKFATYNQDDVKNKIKNKLLQYLWEDVQKSVFNNIRLFDDDIYNFSDLYTRYDNDEQIFSESFINLLFR